MRPYVRPKGRQEALVTHEPAPFTRIEVLIHEGLGETISCSGGAVEVKAALLCFTQHRHRRKRIVTPGGVTQIIDGVSTEENMVSMGVPSLRSTRKLFV